MRWCRSHRFDPAARALADRHYSRQKPGTNQFVRAGSCLVLLTNCGRALWVTSWQQWCRHAWAGAWECVLYRSEGAGRGIELIRHGVAATRAHYGEPPALGMVTMIDPDETKPIMVRGERVVGWTWRKAGFQHVGKCGDKDVFQMLPNDMPEPMAAKPRTMRGTPLFDAQQEPANV